ncbi:hypothetical protein PoB_007145800 [Plakobranchus ocellatus]|uniref:Uncharacterized protein n=1 Tax=Plakobranchus ocellatus TaxID=259542 RepID=A0AAV4DL26_9GAST|nr:hypothetical protein PoB_007145800 [Plakobranchus ocellatus]
MKRLYHVGVLSLACDWFPHGQQDGAPAHFALDVRAYLNATFPDRWIGRVSVNSPAPHVMASTELLSACDNYLWGYVNKPVSKKRYDPDEQSKEVVIAAFVTITQPLLQKMCSDNDGDHTDPLDI